MIEEEESGRGNLTVIKINRSLLMSPNNSMLSLKLFLNLSLWETGEKVQSLYKKLTFECQTFENLKKIEVWMLSSSWLVN